MNYSQYKEEMYILKENMHTLSDDSINGLTAKDRVTEAVRLIETIESELFLGQTEIQPIKFHQLIRIYKLAKTFIDVIVIIWPIIRELLKLFGRK